MLIATISLLNIVYLRAVTLLSGASKVNIYCTYFFPRLSGKDWLTNTEKTPLKKIKMYEHHTNKTTNESNTTTRHYRRIETDQS